MGIGAGRASDRGAAGRGDHASVANAVNVSGEEAAGNIHAPKGPIENVAGFVPRDAQGQVLAWERDGTDMFRFLVPRQEAAEGPTTVELTYITNQSSTNSRGVDAFGYRTLGIINWNTALLYLEGLKIVGIDDRVFTRERLQAAVKASKQTGQIELLTLDAQQYVTYTLAYAGGHQYLHAIPVEGRVDRLEQIVAPRRPGVWGLRPPMMEKSFADG